MRLSTDLVAGKPLSSENDIWLRMLVAFDAVFSALSLVLIETVLVG